jgi:hypothetical protein
MSARKARRLELAGQVFGRLTVLGRHGADHHGRVLWGCMCECGTPAVVAGKNLVSGDTQSCGCLRRDMAPFKHHPNARCVAGARFGMLTLVEQVGRKWGSTVWRCACDCGGEREAVGSSLRKGDAKSCGCLKPGPKPKPAKPARTVAPKSTRMSIKPELRTADGSIGAWPKTAPKKLKAGPADNRPAWRPQTEYKALSAPAERATGPKVTVRELPRHDLRFGVDPATRVVGGFATLGIGRYLEVAA